MEQPTFSVCWGEVEEDGTFPVGWQVIALWPAPVNDDACFHAAGFHEMQSEAEGYSESYWDAQADRLHSLIVQTLSKLDESSLLSFPLTVQRPWFRFWQEPIWLPLEAQLEGPILNDNLPDCMVRFGTSAGIRTGSGHRLYWLGFAPQGRFQLPDLLSLISAEWKVRHIRLDWSALGIRHVELV
jgi:hypothetical protein